MKKHPLAELIESGKDKGIEYGDLYVRRFSNGVLNLTTLGREKFERAHLDAFREDLLAAGYREKESWVATQGASWLSDGVFAGVSMEIEAKR